MLLYLVVIILSTLLHVASSKNVSSRRLSVPTNSPTIPGWPQYYYMAPGENCPEMTSTIASVLASNPYNPCPETFPYMVEYEGAWWCRDDSHTWCHMSVSGWPAPPGATWGTLGAECGLSVYEKYSQQTANGGIVASGDGRHDILDEAECIAAFQALFPDQAGFVTFAGHYDSPLYPRGCAWADHADFGGLHVLINYHAHGAEYDLTKRCCDMHVKYGVYPGNWAGLTHQTDRDWYSAVDCSTRMGGHSSMPNCDFHTAICKNYDWEFPDDLYAPLFDPTSAWVDYNSDGCGPQGSSYTSTAACAPHEIDGISYTTTKEPLVQITPGGTSTEPTVKLIRHSNDSTTTYNPCPPGWILALWNQHYWCAREDGRGAWCEMDESGWPPPADGQWGYGFNNDPKCTGYATFSSSDKVCAFYDWTVYHCRVNMITAAPSASPTNPTNEPTVAPTSEPTTDSPTFDPNVYWQLNEFYPKTDGTCTEACNKHVANSHAGVESDDPNVCGSATFPY